MTFAHDLLLFTLSISQNRLINSILARALGWRFYNSKSSIPNKSASPFRKITIRSPLQWLQDLVLNGAFTSTLQPIPLKNKMSLPAKAQSKIFNTGSNKAPTKVLTLPKAPTSPLIAPSTKDLFTKFIKVFMEMIKAQPQVLTKPQEWLLKIWTPKMYWDKSHIECYHFCQKCEDYFEISSAIKMNCIPFAASFFHGTISFKWAQHQHYHQNATLIT